MRPIRIPATIEAQAAEQAGLVDAQQCQRAGIGSHTRTRLLRAGRWSRPLRGVYDVGLPQADSWQARQLRTLWLGLLAGGPDAVAVGLGALLLHGCWGLPAQPEPEVGLPHGRGNTGPAGVRIRRFRKPMDLIPVGTRGMVTVRTALIQALPEVGRKTGVAILDSALNRGLLATGQVEAVHDGIRGRRGAALVHQWWPLHDSRAESPLETHARLDCIDHGLAPDELQLTIHDEQGAVLGRGDLAWRLRGGRGWVLVELDGIDVHSTPTAVFADRARQNALTTHGVTVLRFTGADVRRPGTIARAVRQLLRVRSSAA
ncbi:MAG: hypothetical protein ACK5H2_02965 [Beutenbergiaceae bacterium]